MRLVSVSKAVVAVLFMMAVDCDAKPTSELRRLVTLSRHGSRAPNDVIPKICPLNLPNFNAYHVPAGQLTEVGMQQLVTAGQHLRDVYVKEKHFLAPQLSGVNHTHFETYFRSDAALRCSQSAALLGLGLYPEGTGPAGFPHQSVAVTMQLLQNEFDFAAPKGPCHETLKKDTAHYGKTRGKELLQKHRDAVERLGELCGVSIDDVPKMFNGEDRVLAIKDLSDMLTFDHDEGLPPLEGMTHELRQEIQQLSFMTLMERYYSTDRQITYWAGGFPALLQQNLNAAAYPGSPSDLDFRYMSYHGHRELLHAMARMLGWNFTFAGLPSVNGHSALYPGTMMIFELHARPDPSVPRGEDYFVKTFVWSPKTRREQVKLGYCSSTECPLEEFNAIIDDHIKRTGTWQSVCSFQDSATTPQFAQMNPVQSPCRGHDWAWIVVGTGLATAMVQGALFIMQRLRIRRMRQDYEMLP